MLTNSLVLALAVPVCAAPFRMEHAKPVQLSRDASFGGALTFEPNLGQSDPAVRWIAHGAGYAFYLTESEAVAVSGDDVIRMRLSGGARLGAAIPLEPTGGVSNYYIGNNSKQWRSGVRHYSKLRFADVYPGIDLIYYSAGSALEYDFVVKPGADAGRIRMAFEGGSVRVENGDVVVSAMNGFEMRHRAPRIYQEWAGRQVEVAGGYQITGTQVGFAVAAYDRSRPLVIDPYVYSLHTFLGPLLTTKGLKKLVMSGQAVYAAVNRIADQYPSQPARPGMTKFETMAVTKLSTSGTTIYSTFIAAQKGPFISNSLTVDPTGAVLVAGFAEVTCTDFPIQNALFADMPGADGFLLRLTPAGALDFSTYFGAEGYDDATAVAVDSLGNIAITGATSSANFPLRDAFQAQKRGLGDAFLTKLSPNGQQILFSTYFGGDGDNDYAFGVGFDPNFRVYMMGRTNSTNFPTLNPFSASNGGSHDAFVSKFSSSGALIYSTYIGGSGFENPTGFAVDSTGAAYIAGGTDSPNFPLMNASQSSSLQGSGFITKLNPAGNTLAFSTFLGGSGQDSIDSLALANGEIWVTGFTNSSNFPLAVKPFRDFSSSFVAGLSAAGVPFYSALFPTTAGQSSVTGGNCSRFVFTSSPCYFVGSAADTVTPVNGAQPVQPKIGTAANAYVFKIVYQQVLQQ